MSTHGEIEADARRVRSPTGDSASDALLPALERLVKAVHRGSERDAIAETEAAMSEAVVAAGISPDDDTYGWRHLLVVLACVVPPDVDIHDALGWRHDPPGFQRLVQSGVGAVSAARRIRRDAFTQLRQKHMNQRGGRSGAH